MPILLVDELSQALRRSAAPLIHIGNLAREHSPAGALRLPEKLHRLSNVMGGRHIDAAIVGPQTEIGRLSADVTIVQEMLAADDITYRHDRVRLRAAIEQVLQRLG